MKTYFFNQTVNVYFILGLTMFIEDFLQSCNFMLKANGKYTLKKKHMYYGQVQLGMSLA